MSKFFFFNGLSFHTRPSIIHQVAVSLTQKIMNLINLIFAISLIYFPAIIVTVQSEEILGCGGFIKSHAEIDFSKVEVKL